jgi:hypothetical protein
MLIASDPQKTNREGPVARLATTARRCLAGRDPFDIATAILLALLLAVAVLVFRDYGISNDEAVQQRYGEMIIAYYTSGFTDRSLFSFDNLYLYGGLFDLVVILLAKAVPLGLYDLRHLVCALTGIAGIAATGATARLIAGSRAGFLAALMLALCGVWFGSMFNHTKDIPFAAAMIGATFFLLRIARDLPRPAATDVAIFGLLLGAALGLRVMGLLLVIYAGVASLVALALHGATSPARLLKAAARSAIAFAPALLLGYLIMIAAWPWAARAPLNPIRAVLEFSHFDYAIRTLLAGQVYEMADVPRWYVPAYLAIKLPLTLLAGVGLALAFALGPGNKQAEPSPLKHDPEKWEPLFGKRSCSNKELERDDDSKKSHPALGRREIALVAFTALFPVLCQVIARGPAFTGLRHFLYVVPPLAVLAGIGADSLLARLQRWRRWAAAGAGAVLALALLWNAALLMRLHPYEYLFYNALVGGLPGASGRYDTDYWVNILPEALRRLQSHLAQTGARSPPYYVTVCSERSQFEYARHGDLQYTEEWERADFFISPTHMDCDRVMEGETIIRIERLGALIGVVKDRRAITRKSDPPAR